MRTLKEVRTDLGWTIRLRAQRLEKQNTDLAVVQLISSITNKVIRERFFESTGAAFDFYFKMIPVYTGEFKSRR